MPIDYGIYNSGALFLKIGSSARLKMYAKFLELAKPSESDLVLDVGVTPNNATLGNNFFEKLYPYTKNITMCTVEDAKNLESEFPGAKFVRNTAGEPLPFADKQFDIVFCSAVIEHTGDYPEQEKFLAELIRVGKKVFLTTPNKNFPVELHTVLPFVHWLPRKIHQNILSMLGMRFYAKTENLNLLNAKRIKIFMSNLKQIIPPPPPPRALRYEITYNRLLGLRSNIILFIESPNSKGDCRNGNC
ncbi:MAG: hypothetical protein Pg6A_03390 [Termitinemataceae bacterium]|nr:MAG: hypothetical protein Pg6A_03390 [Termitinemataceae bacterium]